MPKNDQLKDKSVQNKKDPIKIAIENNSCGICRANGLLPPCRGHGGGSGGGNEEKKEKTDISTQFANKSSRIDNAFSYLKESLNWTQVSSLDNALVYINPNASLTLKLDSK